MFDKAKTRRKIAAVSCIAVVMGASLYVYDINAADVERGVHAVTGALSPMRALKERALATEFEKGGPVAAVPQDMPWEGVPAFVYHGIVKKGDRFSMTADVFKDQMFALKRAGYRTVTLRDFQAFARGEKKLPPKSFLLTFDDGRTDSYEGADPILKALGFNAVMFVASGASMPSEDVRWSYYISPNDIKDMLDSGRWEIGSHAIQADGGYVPIDSEGTKANFLSSRKWLAADGRLETDEEYAARVMRELSESKHVMEEAFRIPIDAFSYPFGDYGQQTKNQPGAVPTIDALASLSYRIAFRQVWPNDGEYAFNHAGDPPLRLKRIETPTDWSGTQLVDFMESARDKTVPYRDATGRDPAWKGTWGDVHPGGGGLVVAADANSAGAAAFLDGTRAWRDYAYSLLFDRTGGSHVSLMARYVDAKNHLVCTFGEGRVQIEQVVDGVPERLADAATDTERLGLGVAGMRVSGTSVECLLGSTPVASATATDGTGGVGVRVWDRDLKTAGIIVRSAVITPLE
ncbi:MAG TPA: polysaccharide deacetylase family protein [Candidatus Baltobacteraceae bacterium]|nr:polysaccharide deacetylase family protein [Candidatus Baltobacteraceae bacterium]